MKRCVLVFMLALCSLNVWAQRLDAPKRLNWEEITPVFGDVYKVVVLQYRLDETEDTLIIESSYCYVFNDLGHVSNRYTYDENGELVTSDEYGFGINDCMTTHERYDASHKRISRRYYEYRGDLVSEIDSFDGDGVHSGSILFEYDANGNETKRLYYDETGELCESIVFEYDPDIQKVVSGRVYWGSGDPCFSVKYKYDSFGRIIAVSHFSASGDLMQENLYSYDRNGNIYVVTSYDENGEILSIREYSYDSMNNVVRINIYDKNGIHIGAEIFEYEFTEGWG